MRIGNLLLFGMFCVMLGLIAMAAVLVGFFADFLRSAGLLPLWFEMSYLLIAPISILMYITNSIGMLPFITKEEARS